MGDNEIAQAGPQETTEDHPDFKTVKMTKSFSLNKNPHSTVFNVERTAKLRQFFWNASLPELVFEKIHIVC